MTIDFSQITGILYFYGTKPSGTTFVAKLKGKYSNEYLNFASSGITKTELPLTSTDTQTNWYSFSWGNSYNATKDIAGYYILELYADASLVSSTLVKVINPAGEETDVVFTSPDNENNEQIVYYR